MKLVDQILADAFEAAQSAHPTAMAPYIARLADPVPTHEREAIMQAGLRALERAKPAPDDFYVACSWPSCKGMGFPAGYGAAKLASQCACLARLPRAPASPSAVSSAETSVPETGSTESHSWDRPIPQSHGDV